MALRGAIEFMALYESFMIVSSGFSQQGARRKEEKALDLSVMDIPTVIHCHEISHEKEWVCQHAHSDLKAQKTRSLTNVHCVRKPISSFGMSAKLSSFGYKGQTSLRPRS